MESERPHRVHGRIDTRLRARVVSRTPLVYVEGADTHEDRPAFVRAASGIARFAGGFAVVQDDAGFVALVRPDARARAVALPRGPDERRRFEKRLGNKNDKLDLESCFSVGVGADERLVSFGSGSMPARERILVLSADDGTRLVDAAALYSALRDFGGFTDAPPNIEGAAIVGTVVRLFHRANGKGGGTTRSADMHLDAFLAWLDGRAALPDFSHPIEYDLGAMGGVALSFTDVCNRGARTFFLACAEDSPDAIDDGAVLGSVLGVVAEDDARMAPLIDETGAGGTLKAEGLVVDADRARAFIVLDQDDPDVPSALCEVALEGPWGLD